jgi:hypothetical protein
MKFYVENVPVYFPYPFVYEEQYAYMRHLKRAIDRKGKRNYHFCHTNPETPHCRPYPSCVPRKPLHAGNANWHGQDGHAAVVRDVVPAALRGEGRTRSQTRVLHPHCPRNGEGPQRAERGDQVSAVRVRESIMRHFGHRVVQPPESVRARDNFKGRTQRC